MIRSAYATGLKGVGPECPTSSRDPKRYFYGAGTGHMALDEEGSFVLVNAGRRVYMSQVAKPTSHLMIQKEAPAASRRILLLVFFFQ